MDREGLRIVPEAAPSVQPDAPGLRVASPVSRGGSFRALHSKPFRLYFAGQVASASGTFLQATAIGWLVLKVTGSASSLGLVLAAGGLPSLLFGPWGGSIVDRVDLRTLLIGTQTAFALLAGVLWIVATADHASVALVVTITVIGRFVQIVDSPARQSFVSALVEPADLTSAVSLNGVVMNSARVVGVLELFAPTVWAQTSWLHTL